MSDSSPQPMATDMPSCTSVAMASWRLLTFGMALCGNYSPCSLIFMGLIPLGLLRGGLFVSFTTSDRARYEETQPSQRRRCAGSRCSDRCFQRYPPEFPDLSAADCRVRVPGR